MPAHPVEGHEEIWWESDPPGGNLKSQRHDMKTGLTKREAAAIAIRAGLGTDSLGLPLVPASDDPADGQRRLTHAEYAVREANALFDELEKTTPPAQTAAEGKG